MLQTLSHHIKACLDRSADAERRAKASNDADMKAAYMQIADRWLVLARSYGFVESLERFLFNNDHIRRLESRNYVGFAHEFSQLATDCKDDFVREQLLNMARSWMALAMDEAEIPRDKNTKPKIDGR